ncbi:MAG: type II toxin-antitoxin system HicB family antitoxin [Thermoleophilaceae bacterium]|nr:type II toxin-antitoxin system HicB family antitoxin [Thermoleophilaceae bacterium]
MTSETAAGILRGDHDDYLILIETGRASVNYSACSPEVPGCVAVGDTIDRTAWEMRAALVGHLDVMLHSLATQAHAVCRFASSRSDQPYSISPPSTTRSRRRSAGRRHLYSFSLNNEFYGGDVVKPDED